MSRETLTAETILRLTAERDRARVVAVALEGQVARVEALRDKWARQRGNATDFDYGRWHRAAALELDAALDPDPADRGTGRDGEVES